MLEKEVQFWDFYMKICMGALKWPIFKHFSPNPFKKEDFVKARHNTVKPLWIDILFLKVVMKENNGSTWVSLRQPCLELQPFKRKVQILDRVYGGIFNDYYEKWWTHSLP